MRTLIFIRGLNTWGDDFVRLGPVKIGRMEHLLKSAFQAHDIRLVSLKDLGVGTIEDHVKRASRSIEQLESKGLIQGDLHLLGHSAGGLFARALVHEPQFKTRVRSLITFGTPHRGTRLAELAFDFQQTRPKTYQGMKTFGYDIAKKLQHLKELKSSSLEKFNQKFLDIPGCRYSSFVLSLPEQDLSWPLRSLQILRSDPLREPSDGIVEESSQAWGEVLDHLPLDHLCQLGFNFYLSPPLRRKAQKHFKALVERVALETLKN